MKKKKVKFRKAVEMKNIKYYQDRLDECFPDEIELSTDQDLLVEIELFGLGWTKFHTADIERLISQKTELESENKELIEKKDNTISILQRVFDEHISIGINDKSFQKYADEFSDLI